MCIRFFFLECHSWIDLPDQQKKPDGFTDEAEKKHCEWGGGGRRRRRKQDKRHLSNITQANKNIDINTAKDNRFAIVLVADDLNSSSLNVSDAERKTARGGQHTGGRGT